MTEIMQAEQSAHKTTVAAQKVSHIILHGKNTKGQDARLVVLLEVCAKEQADFDEEPYRSSVNPEKWAKEWCFGTYITLYANWCVKQCLNIPAGQYPKSRKYLAKGVVDGLLGTRGEADRQRFAEFLCTWPEEDGKLAAEAFREIAEFRWKGRSYEKEIRPVFDSFFRVTSVVLYRNADVVRQVFKLMGHWADINDVYRIGQFSAVMHSRVEQPLLDLVQHALAQ